MPLSVGERTPADVCLGCRRWTRFGGQDPFPDLGRVETVERRWAGAPVTPRGKQTVVHDDRPAAAVSLLFGVALIPRQDLHRPLLLATVGMDAGAKRPQHIRDV